MDDTTPKTTAEAIMALANAPTPLSLAMKHIGRIEKDKENKHGGYKYLSEEAVKVGVHHALVANGLSLDSVTFEVLSDDWIDAKSGRANLIKLRCTVKVAGGVFDGLGAGIDYGDKALFKAQTGAFREALKIAFVIGTGTDPEADEDSPTFAKAAEPEPARKPPSARAKQPEKPAGEKPTEAQVATLRLVSGKAPPVARVAVNKTINGRNAGLGEMTAAEVLALTKFFEMANAVRGESEWDVEMWEKQAKQYMGENHAA